MADDKTTPPPKTPHLEPAPKPQVPAATPVEIGGTKGPDPTRYGDWEHNGRCVDF
jgi:hypothetical protein